MSSNAPQQVKTPRGPQQRQHAQLQPSPLTRLAMSYLQQQVSGSSSRRRAQTDTDGRGWRLPSSDLSKHPADEDGWEDYESLLKQWRDSGPSATLCAWVREQLLTRIDDVLADPIDALRFRAFETLTQQARTLVRHWSTSHNGVERTAAAQELSVVLKPVGTVLYFEDIVMDRYPDFLDAGAVKKAFERARQALAASRCDGQRPQQQARRKQQQQQNDRKRGGAAT